MTHAINLIAFVIMTLASLVMAFVGFVDSFLAALMTSAGIPPNVQIVLLVIIAAFLVVLAIRALGRVFAVLIIVLLVLLLVHQVFPGLEVPQDHVPTWLHLPENPRFSI